MTRKINGHNVPREISLLSDDKLRAILRHDNKATGRDTLLTMLSARLMVPSPRGRKASACSTEESARVTRHKLLAQVQSGKKTVQQAIDRLSIDRLLQDILSETDIIAASRGEAPARKQQQDLDTVDVSQYSREGLLDTEYWNEYGDIVRVDTLVQLIRGR